MRLEPIDHDAADPPFEQVRRQIAAQVASGDLTPGTRLPTVRALAEQTGLAVNTVARVYRELEAEGVVVTEGRGGTSVRPSSAGAGTEVRSAATAYVDAARRAGLGLADAQRLVETSWTPHP
jgi:DNA-binding transcriptional regulator YhcF (GntR family)